MANFFNTPLFGLTLSVLAYTLGLLLYRRFPNPLTTPLLNYCHFALYRHFLQGLLCRWFLS